jgi:aspartokinase-like uncharacterized kinase
LSTLPVRELKHHQGGVDEYLSVVLASLNLATWVISGQQPERLVELLNTGQTIGTRINRE